MLRHKRSVHPQENLSDTESDHDLSEDNDNSDAEGDENEKYDPWESLIEKTFDLCKEEFEEYVDNLTRRRHMDQTDARRKAYKDLQPKFRKVLRSLFVSRMSWFKAMEQDPIDKTVQRTVKDLIAIEDFNKQEALKYAISKRKYLLDTVLEDFDPPEIEDHGESEEDGPSAKRIKV